MISTIYGTDNFSLEFDKSQSLNQLLTKSYLNQNPIEVLKEIVLHLTHQNQQAIEWEKIDSEVLEVMIDLFLNQGTDDQLKYFVDNHVCAIDSEFIFLDENLIYPNLTKLFFKKIVGYEERLANLSSLHKPLLAAMCLTKNGINSDLIHTFYKKHPQGECWNYVRKEVSRYSNVIYLRPIVWYLDIAALFEKSLAKEEVEIQLQELLEDFEFDGNDELLVPFVSEVLLNKALLCEEKIHLLIQGIVRSTSFTTKDFEWYFIKHALGLRKHFWEEYQLDCDSLIVPMLKSFILMKAESNDLDLVFCQLTTKEQLRAVLKGLDACPEPLKTLHIRRFISCLNDKEILKDLEAVFKDAHLEYKEFPPIDGKLYQSAFSIRNDLESFQKIDNQDNLGNFWKKIKTTKQFDSWLAALTDGLIFSNKLILKPKLEKNKIKDFVAEKGFSFMVHGKPIFIDQFFEE